MQICLEAIEHFQSFSQKIFRHIIIIITDIFYIVALEAMSRYNYSLWWEIDPFNK